MWCLPYHHITLHEITKFFDDSKTGAANKATPIAMNYKHRVFLESECQLDNCKM